MSAARKLTEVGVAKIRAPETGRLQIPDAIVTGLWLRISANNVRTWSLLYRVGGDKRVRRLTLGRWRGISVAGARALAKAALLEIAAGKDPAAEKHRHDGIDTVATVVAEFVERHVKRKRPRSWRAAEALLARYVVEAWGERKIATISRSDILRLVDTIMDRGHARTACLVLGAIQALFKWAVEREIVATNCAAGIAPPAASRERARVLSDDELCRVWRAAAGLPGPSARFVRLLCLLGQRRGETAGMNWSEIDQLTSTWTIAASRSKNNRAHAVPLSAAALALIGTPPATAEGPVLGTIRGYAHIKTRLDKACQVSGWTFHDLRRTATSGMARLGVEPHVLSRILNHSDTGTAKVTAVYNRHKYLPQQRAALEVWAQHVFALAQGHEQKVVPLRR